MAVKFGADLKSTVGMENFGARLRMIMQEESTSSFARKCGISSESVKKYLNSKTIPGADKALAISKGANVSLSWLISGEGEPQAGQLSEEDVTRWWMNIAELLTPEQKRQIISDFHKSGVEGVFKRLPASKDGLPKWVK